MYRTLRVRGEPLDKQDSPDDKKANLHTRGESVGIGGVQGHPADQLAGDALTPPLSGRGVGRTALVRGTTALAYGSKR